MTSTCCYSPTFSYLYYCCTPVLWSFNDVFLSSTFDVRPPSVSVLRGIWNKLSWKSAFINICSLLNWTAATYECPPWAQRCLAALRHAQPRDLTCEAAVPWTPFPHNVQHSHSFKGRLLKTLFTLTPADALCPGSGLYFCDTCTSFWEKPSFLSIRCSLL